MKSDTFRLSLNTTELATCVGCGLCLPHCPTFRVTGEEGLSPRGRIAAMRQVHDEGLPADDRFVELMETCVQCRGCEPACPSGVPFGHLMEGARSSLASAKRTVPWWQRVGYRFLGHHRLLLVGSTALAAAQRLGLVPKGVALPSLALRRGKAVQSSGTDVWFFTGCVMDAWMRSTHQSSAAVLAAAGVGIRIPERGGDCCGALHVHAGLHHQAVQLAERVMASMPGDAPIVVNSAGCGAALKDYGHTVATSAAIRFSSRVVDVHEFLADKVDRLPAARSGGRADVIVQDPCHLRHVQRAHLPVRTVLSRYFNIVELDDDGLCCGAGGAYSALQPELAGQVRERKLNSIERATARSGANVVASANPGCAMHLEAAGLTVRHPLDLVAQAIR